MRTILGIIILALIGVIQSIPEFKIYGVLPDLLLIFIIFYSLKISVAQGLIWAAFIGFFQDLLTSSNIGTHIFVNATIAYSVELYKKIFVSDLIPTLSIISLISTFVKYVILFIESLLFSNISVSNWLVLPLIEAGLNFVFAFPMYFVYKWITRFLVPESY